VQLCTLHCTFGKIKSHQQGGGELRVRLDIRTFSGSESIHFYVAFEESTPQPLFSPNTLLKNTRFVSHGGN
jgi:hypothetical protein